jgi:hypothetical protein
LGHKKVDTQYNMGELENIRLSERRETQGYTAPFICHVQNRSLKKQDTDGWLPGIGGSENEE